MLKLNDETYRTLSLFVLAVVALLILATFRDYGITWDEELQSQYGLAVVDYYASLFQDQRYAEIFNLYLYGGMFDGLASLIDRSTPFALYETRHFLNAIFGLLGLWGTWRLARFMGGDLVALLATLFTATTPMFYGHMFNNPKDIPFACGVVWTLYLMVRCYALSYRPGRATIIKLSLILGLTLGIRVGGIMAIIFWAVPPFIDSVLPWLKTPTREHFREQGSRLFRIGVRLYLPVVIMSYGVMLLCWPWAQQSPILNPLRALSEFSNFPQDVEVLLRGTIYRSTQLPWYYIPLYFSVQLPELLLFLVLLMMPFLPSLWGSLSWSRRQAFLLLLLMAFVPLTYGVLFHPALYDAVRHFLFVLPLFSIFAAMTAVKATACARDQFVRRLSKQLILLSLLFVFTLSLVTQILVMVKLHPYEYIFANSLTGGVAGAYGQYELDYWGSSFKEMAELLQKYVAKEGGIPPGRIYKVAICGPWDAAMIYLPPDYEPVVANEPAEFFLSTTRWMCQNMRAGREIIRVERMGVPLSIIKDLRK